MVFNTTNQKAPAKTAGDAWLHRIAPAAVHGRMEVVEPGWFCPRRRLYNHALVVFQSGMWSVEIDDRRQRLGKDTFVIIPPDVSTSYHYLGATPATQCWSHFDWCHLDRPYPTCSYYSDRWERVPSEFVRPAPEWVPKGVFSGHVPTPDHIYELFDRLSSRCRSSDIRLRLTARAVLLEILLLLLGPSEPAPLHDRQSKIRNAVHDLRIRLDHISTRPVGDTLSLEQLATETGYSCGHISRAFKESFGVSPGDYVMRRRLHQARSLLQETALPIGEISQHIGFGYFSHFCRQFKRHVGMSPSDYRRHITED